MCGSLFECDGVKKFEFVSALAETLIVTDFNGNLFLFFFFKYFIDFDCPHKKVLK